MAIALQGGRLVVQTLWIQFRTSETVHVWIVLPAKSSITIRTAGKARLSLGVYLDRKKTSCLKKVSHMRGLVDCRCLNSQFNKDD